MIADDESDNFAAFLDSVSIAVVRKLAQPATKPKKQKAKKKKETDDVISIESSPSGGQDSDELREFVEVYMTGICDCVISSDTAEKANIHTYLPQYLSEEIFNDLPETLRKISYAALQDDNTIAEKYALPLDSKIIETTVKTLPPSISDSLCSYGLINDSSDLDRFLDPILTGYLTAVTAAPPEFTPAIASSRPAGCEICGREHVPLTYHHLIPRQVHGKAVKRGWHREWELNKG